MKPKKISLSERVIELLERIEFWETRNPEWPMGKNIKAEMIGNNYFLLELTLRKIDRAKRDRRISTTYFIRF